MSFYHLQILKMPVNFKNKIRYRKKITDRMEVFAQPVPKAVYLTIPPPRNGCQIECFNSFFGRYN